jgi:hypothetical protein
LLLEVLHVDVGAFDLAIASHFYLAVENFLNHVVGLTAGCIASDHVWKPNWRYTVELADRLLSDVLRAPVDCEVAQGDGGEAVDFGVDPGILLGGELGDAVGRDWRSWMVLVIGEGLGFAVDWRRRGDNDTLDIVRAASRMLMVSST